jgi:hypothetical protein
MKHIFLCLFCLLLGNFAFCQVEATPSKKKRSTNSKNIEVGVNLVPSYKTVAEFNSGIYSDRSDLYRHLVARKRLKHDFWIKAELFAKGSKNKEYETLKTYVRHANGQLGIEKHISYQSVSPYLGLSTFFVLKHQSGSFYGRSFTYGLAPYVGLRVPLNHSFALNIESEFRLMRSKQDTIRHLSNNEPYFASGKFSGTRFRPLSSVSLMYRIPTRSELRKQDSKHIWKKTQIGISVLHESARSCYNAYPFQWYTVKTRGVVTWKQEMNKKYNFRVRVGFNKHINRAKMDSMATVSFVKTRTQLIAIGLERHRRIGRFSVTYGAECFGTKLRYENFNQGINDGKLEIWGGNEWEYTTGVSALSGLNFHLTRSIGIGIESRYRVGYVRTKLVGIDPRGLYDGILHYSKQYFASFSGLGALNVFVEF